MPCQSFQDNQPALERSVFFQHYIIVPPNGTVSIHDESKHNGTLSRIWMAVGLFG